MLDDTMIDEFEMQQECDDLDEVRANSIQYKFAVAVTELHLYNCVRRALAA